MPSPTRRIAHAKKRRFLDAFAELGTITHAAKRAGIERHTHYDWLAKDQVYAAAFADAEDRAIESLERELRRRAVEGFEEPVFYQGEVVGSIRRYSDTCLIFALKGAAPEKYRERVHVVTEDAVDAEIRRLSVELERSRSAGAAVEFGSGIEPQPADG